MESERDPREALTTWRIGGNERIATLSAIEDSIRDAERRLFDRYQLAISERFLEFDVDGSMLRVRVLETGSGQPVLLLHPAAWYAAQWSPLLPHLPGCRLFALDLPGHGLSDGVNYRLHDKRSHFSVLLRAVLSELGLDTVSVVGNSLGGAAAFWLAIDEPALVDRLVILGVPGPVLPGMRADIGLAMLSIPGLNRLLLSLPSSPDQLRKFAEGMLTADGFSRMPPEMFEIQYLASRRPQFAPTLSTFMQTTLRWRTARRSLVLSEAEIAGIEQPVHFIWGADDVFGGVAMAQRAAALMKQATLDVRPAGHYPQLDDPETCGRAICAFLET